MIEKTGGKLRKRMENCQNCDMMYPTKKEIAYETVF